MSFLSGLGKIVGDVAPLASFIPGVGPVAGAAIGAGGKLLAGKGLGGALKGGLEGGLGGFANQELSSPGDSFISKLGAAVKNNFEPEGKLDLGRVLGAAGGVEGLLGQGQQRKSAQGYANAQIAQRNALMSKILTPTNYGLPSPNLNQQSSATSGGY